jgi:hypothetical protein
MSQQTTALIVPDAPCEMPSTQILTRLLDVMAVRGCRFLCAYEASGDWDVDDFTVRERPNELDVPPEEFLALAARHPNHLVSTEIDGRPQQLAELMRHRHPDSFGDWRPLIGTMAIGPHSYPDLEFEDTIWRGNLSIGLFGQGIGDVGAARSALIADCDWLGLASDIARVTGVPMRTEMVAYY